MTQQLTKLTFALVFASTLALFSCSKDSEKDDVINNQNPTNNPPSNEEPTPSKSFYVKGKFDGTWKISQTNQTIYIQVGEAINGSTGYGSSDRATVVINYENGKFTDQTIPALQSDTIKFETSNAISADFHWSESGKHYNTNDVPNSDGYIYISKVAEHSTYQGFKAFTMTGTITCTIEDQDGNTLKVTDASYQVMVTEERW